MKKINKKYEKYYCKDYEYGKARKKEIRRNCVVSCNKKPCDSKWMILDRKESGELYFKELKKVEGKDV